jgi:hypothetical protein
VDVMATLTLISKSLETMKALKDIDKQLGEAEWKAKFAEVLSNMADVKIGLIELREDSDAKDREIARLKAAFEARGETVVYQGYRYDRASDGGPTGYAFCPRCERVDGFMMQLSTSNGAASVCSRCKSEYWHVPVNTFRP